MTGGFAFQNMTNIVEVTNKHGTILLSSEDKEKLFWNWYITPSGYAMFTGGPRSLIHRWVIENVTGVGIPVGMVVDHIDGDALNNARNNLQIITQSVNRLKGKSGQHNRLSNFRRVCYNSKNNKWRSRFTVNGKLYSGGTFDTEREAAIASDIFCVCTLNLQTQLNFPDILDPEKLKQYIKEISL